MSRRIQRAAAIPSTVVEERIVGRRMLAGCSEASRMSCQSAISEVKSSRLSIKPSSTSSSASSSSLLILHNGNLLWRVTRHVESSLTSLLWSWWWKSLSWSWSWRPSVLSSAKVVALLTHAWTGRHARHTTCHLHKLIEIHVLRVHSRRHHLLHHLIHVRHARHRRHARWYRSIAIAAAATWGPTSEHGLHLSIRSLLIRDGLYHRLLLDAVLRPCVLVEAVVEVVGLIGSW